MGPGTPLNQGLGATCAGRVLGWFPIIGTPKTVSKLTSRSTGYRRPFGDEGAQLLTCCSQRRPDKRARVRLRWPVLASSWNTDFYVRRLRTGRCWTATSKVACRGCRRRRILGLVTRRYRLEREWCVHWQIQSRSNNSTVHFSKSTARASRRRDEWNGSILR